MKMKYETECPSNKQPKKLNNWMKLFKLLSLRKRTNWKMSSLVEVESEITQKTDDEAQDLDADNIAAETDTNKLAEDKDQEWV